MSDSVWPHRRQPTRLPRPWDSPGKNTGVGCHFLLQCMKVKSESEVAQSSPTLCDPMDCSPPGSSVHGIFQARALEWVAISFSNAWRWKVKVKSLSRLRLFATPWTVAYQAPPSMGFSRQEYWSGVPVPSPSHGFQWEGLRKADGFSLFGPLPKSVGWLLGAGPYPLSAFPVARPLRQEHLAEACTSGSRIPQSLGSLFLISVLEAAFHILKC